MKIFGWSPREGPDDAGTNAKIQAEKSLEEIQAVAPEVERIVDSLRKHRRENHIAEAIVLSMARKRRRFHLP